MNSVITTANTPLCDIQLPKNLEAARQLIVRHISAELTCLEFLRTPRQSIILQLDSSLLSSKRINSTERLRNHLALRFQYDSPVFEIESSQGVIRVIDDNVFVGQSRTYTRRQLEQYTVIYPYCNRQERDILESADMIFHLAAPKISIGVLLYDWYPKAKAASRSSREQHELMINFSAFLLVLLDSIDGCSLESKKKRSRVVSKQLTEVISSELDESLTNALLNYWDIEPEPEYIIAMLCWFGMDKCQPLSLDEVGAMFRPVLSRTAVKDRVHRSVARYSAFLDIHPVNIWRYISDHGICGLTEFLSHFKSTRMAVRFLCLVCDVPYNASLAKQLTHPSYTDHHQ